MKVGIAGAGAIGLGYAAFLQQNGHDVSVWSPSGGRIASFAKGEPLRVSGVIEGEFNLSVCETPEQLAASEVLVLAVPAYGYRSVIDKLVPFVGARHEMLISSHLSFAALYLAQRLAARGLRIPIAAWNTTALTCKTQTPTEIKIGALRKSVDIGVVPVDLGERGLQVSTDLFGPRFNLRDDLLTITFSNVNPQGHLALALCNLTRIERGQAWGQRDNTTPAVGRLIEALDAERRLLAQNFGKTVGTVFDHYRQSFGVTANSVAEIASLMVQRGSDVWGPTTIDTRYVLEDVPYGLVPMLYLADMAGCDIPLHRSGTALLGACYGRDFAHGNDILAAIAVADENDLRSVIATGTPRVPCVRTDAT